MAGSDWVSGGGDLKFIRGKRFTAPFVLSWPLLDAPAWATAPAGEFVRHGGAAA